MLPNELFESIFDFLEGDFSTLRSLALSGPQLLPLAQKRIFRKVRVHDQEMKVSNWCKRLLGALESNPELAGYIAVFQLVLLTPAQSRVVMRDSVLPMLLGCLTNLRTLMVLIRGNWGTLPLVLAKAIGAVITSDSLQRFEAWWTQDIPAGLLLNSKIQELELHSAPFDMSDLDAERHKELNTSRRPLRCLSLLNGVQDLAMDPAPNGPRGLNTRLDKLSLLFDFTNLQTLSFPLGRHRCSESFEYILRLCGSTLEELTLNIYGERISVLFALVNRC